MNLETKNGWESTVPLGINCTFWIDLTECAAFPKKVIITTSNPPCLQVDFENASSPNFFVARVALLSKLIV